MVLCISMNRKNVLFFKIEITLIQSILSLEPLLIHQNDLKKMDNMNRYSIQYRCCYLKNTYCTVHLQTEIMKVLKLIYKCVFIYH
jgi:hypothetical protein